MRLRQYQVNNFGIPRWTRGNSIVKKKAEEVGCTGLHYRNRIVYFSAKINWNFKISQWYDKNPYIYIQKIKFCGKIEQVSKVTMQDSQQSYPCWPRLWKCLSGSSSTDLEYFLTQDLKYFWTQDLKHCWSPDLEYFYFVQNLGLSSLKHILGWSQDWNMFDCSKIKHELGWSQHFRYIVGWSVKKCLVQVRLSPVSWDFHFLKPWLVFWFNWKGETFFHQLKS